MAKAKKSSAKSIGAKLDALRIRRAQLAEELAKLEDAVEKRNGIDDDLDDIESEMEALVEELFAQE